MTRRVGSENDYDSPEDGFRPAQRAVRITVGGLEDLDMPDASVRLPTAATIRPGIAVASRVEDDPQAFGVATPFAIGVAENVDMADQRQLRRMFVPPIRDDTHALHVASPSSAPGTSTAAALAVISPRDEAASEACPRYGSHTIAPRSQGILTPPTQELTHEEQSIRRRARKQRARRFFLLLVVVVICVVVPMTFLPSEGTDAEDNDEHDSNTVVFSTHTLRLLEPQPNDGFGFAVAIDGDTAVVGAPYYDFGSFKSVGAAYVFIHNIGGWFKQDMLTLDAAERGQKNYFGYSVAIHQDTIVIGALGVDDPISNSGSAFVFMRNGTSWRQHAKLTAGERAKKNGHFGAKVAVSHEFILVGSANHGDSVFVYKKDGTQWINDTIIEAPEGIDVRYSQFGQPVDVDGNIAVIGAWSGNYYPPVKGSAFAFRRNEEGTWSVIHNFTHDEEGNGGFGMDLSVSGNTTVVGAPYFESVYVFIWDGSSWAMKEKKGGPHGSKAYEPGGSLHEYGFGGFVDVRRNRLIVCAPYTDKKGAAYLYMLQESGSTSMAATLLPSDPPEGERQFGWSLSFDGKTAIIGANKNKENIGRAYLFEDLPEA